MPIYTYVYAYVCLHAIDKSGEPHDWILFKRIQSNLNNLLSWKLFILNEIETDSGLCSTVTNMLCDSLGEIIGTGTKSKRHLILIWRRSIFSRAMNAGTNYSNTLTKGNLNVVVNNVSHGMYFLFSFCLSTFWLFDLKAVNVWFSYKESSSKIFR